MKKSKQLTYALAFACMIAALLTFPFPAEASTFEVNAADDVDDGTCDDSHCSLREAINAANANPGPDSITFDIPGPGPHVILLTDLLTMSDDQTRIDGSSQPGYPGSPVIVLDGGSTLCRGLWIASNDNIVLGLSFVRFNCPTLSTAIHIWGGVLGDGERNRIEKNYIGVDASGAPAGNVYGVMLWNPNNIIRGNVISGNFIAVMASEGYQIIEGNRIGTNPAGTMTSSGYGNETGILLQAGADHTRIGGADPSQRNLISGNELGIDIESERVEVAGNFIGTNLAGGAALPNLNGVDVHGDYNLIGGADPSEGNLISGNHGQALTLEGSFNAVFGNLIGTDRSGMTDLPNFVGINVLGDENVIGGSGPGEGNVISGNEVGIWYPQPANDNRALGNMIGTSIDGASPIGNTYGIKILWGAHDNAIGGVNTNEGNLIAFNAAEGIQIGYDAYENPILGNTIHSNSVGVWIFTDALKNSISRNSIYGNTGLGIDLETVGVNPNDPGDVDIGANALLNFPEITSAGTTSVSGTACAGCIIELFISDQDPSGHGEGRTYIDTTTADTSGNFTIPVFFPIASCTRVTATATDSSGNTSEFSENHIVGLCMVFPWPWVIIFCFGLIGAGAIVGRYAGRFTALSPGTTAAIGAVFGAVLTAGLVTLAIVHPSIQIERAKEVEDFPSMLPPCSQYLDPDRFSPADGTVFELSDDPLLDWSQNPEGPIAPGVVRWVVDLRDDEGNLFSQNPISDPLAFSSFNIPPSPGAGFYWRVGFAVAPTDGEPFETFCLPTGWRSFSFMPPVAAPIYPPEDGTPPSDTPTPTMTPTTTPTPSPAVCVYTALQNANCRASDYVESAQIAILMQGEIAELIALNPEFTHGMFELQNQQQCWIWLGLMDGPPNPFGTCGVPIVDPPPRPTDTPTPLACRPDMDQKACEASGGTWSGGVVGSTGCLCPD